MPLPFNRCVLVRACAIAIALMLASSTLIAAQESTPVGQSGTQAATTVSSEPFGESLSWMVDTLNSGAATLTADEVNAHFDSRFLESIPAEVIVEFLQQTAALGPFTFEGYTRPPTETQANALLTGIGGLMLVASVSVDPASPERLTGFNLAPVPAPTGVELAPVVDPSATPTPGMERHDGLVNIGGRGLFISCSGTGTPTVLLEAGLNDGAAPWFAIEQAIAPTTRVCSYDRANVAASASDSVPSPRTGRHVVVDLHALLAEAGVPGPYVLVGHSMGGIFSRLYASTYPDEVAGMVLVDASHEDQDVRLEQLIGPELFAQIKLSDLTIEGIDTEATFNEVRESRTISPLHPLPLVVISAGAYDPASFPPDWPVAEFLELRRELSADLATLVPGAQQVVAEQSGHYVHQTQPDVVVDAINQVVSAVRDPSTWATSTATTPATPTT